MLLSPRDSSITDYIANELEQRGIAPAGEVEDWLDRLDDDRFLSRLAKPMVDTAQAIFQGDRVAAKLEKEERS